MLIKLLSLINVVNAKGKEIDQGSTVRYLSEMIWFPAAALCNYIKWQQIDSTSVLALIDYGGIKTSGLFKFNENYDVISFQAKRYYSRNNKYTLEDWFIQIIPNSYNYFEGVRIPTKATVTWKLKEGDFMWLKLKVNNIKYN